MHTYIDPMIIIAGFEKPLKLSKIIQIMHYKRLKQRKRKI